MSSNLTIPGPESPGNPFSVEVPALLKQHFEALRAGSGLSLDVIRERGYRSILGKRELQALGFTAAQQRVPGVLLPLWTPDGTEVPYCYRPDFPREGRDGKSLKYEFPPRAAMRLDVSPRCRPALADPKIQLWITEGIKKADALATQGLAAIDLLGVWNFKGKNEFGGVVLLADFDRIALNGRTVNSDVMTKPQVRQALARLTEHLQRKGALVNPVYLPAGKDREKVGVDDYLLCHTVADLEALVLVPPPLLKPAAPAVELLDEPPPALSRPLDVIDGVSYVAAFPYVKKTSSEAVGKDGAIVRLDPPIAETSRVMIVIRNDGKIFGPGGDETLGGLGFDVSLKEPPRDQKLWRVKAVKKYKARKRPDYAVVFNRIAAAYDRFLDFSRSVADQGTMCEFSACASLITWFAAAFTVLGYFWPTGDKGSGKTKWGNIWAMTSYLGEVLLSSGSFAAVRDLAHYGAALMFDDAEIIADPKRCDPDKRELLLAGNRRGAAIPVKEPQPNGGWATRWVNAFCPRAFTAIRTPDPVLASRAIPVPTDPAVNGAAHILIVRCCRTFVSARFLYGRLLELRLSMENTTGQDRMRNPSTVLRSPGAPARIRQTTWRKAELPRPKPALNPSRGYLHDTPPLARQLLRGRATRPSARAPHLIAETYIWLLEARLRSTPLAGIVEEVSATMRDAGDRKVELMSAFLEPEVLARTTWARHGSPERVHALTTAE